MMPVCTEERVGCIGIFRRRVPSASKNDGLPGAPSGCVRVSERACNEGFVQKRHWFVIGLPAVTTKKLAKH